jgi:hypothetical protein
MGRSENRVGTLARILDHSVAGIVDEIDIVAGTADHEVGASRTVDKIADGGAD